MFPIISGLGTLLPACPACRQAGQAGERLKERPYLLAIETKGLPTFSSIIVVCGPCPG